MSIVFELTDAASCLGHHFVVRLNAPQLDPVDQRVLEELRPIGVHIGEHNFLQDAPYGEWLDAFRDLLDDVRKKTGRKKMLISIDHEGGRVHRVPPPLTRFPYPQVYACHSSEVAKIMARELTSIGVNFSCAPSADIHSNPANPVIGPRAFGTDAEEVVRWCVPFFREHDQLGMVTCAKHFPGHGDTSVDSHVELPLISASLEELRQRELVPFQSLIDVGVPVVMPAHILFQELDPKLPASLSRPVIDGVLRSELGFSGVVLTDDLDMKAILDNFDDEMIGKAAITAGCDLLLFNHDPERALRVGRELLKHAKSDDTLQSALELSCTRVKTLADSYELASNPYLLDDECLQRHHEVAKQFPVEAGGE